MRHETFRSFARNSPGNVLSLSPIFYLCSTKNNPTAIFNNGICFRITSAISQTLIPNNIYWTRLSQREEFRRHNYITFLSKRICLKFCILWFSQLNPYKQNKLSHLHFGHGHPPATNSGLKD